jgi:hypothetical protein
VGARRAVAGALALLAGLAAVPRAAAYCRTSACERGDTGTRCSPAREEDCGVPLFWKERCIGFSVQRDGSLHLSAETLAELVTQAFAKWNAVECEGGRPRFVVQRQPDAACAAPEYNVDINFNRGNANVVMFRDEEWPHPGYEDALALTTVTFDAVTGEIHDADIEINTFNFPFTTEDAQVAYDLLSTIQHETGHLLGVSHSETGDSVMYDQPELGSIRRRELTTDDAAAICAVYPADLPPIAATCSPVPRDFAPGCEQELSAPSAPEPDGGCSASPTRAPAGARTWLAAACVVALASLLRLRRAAGRAPARS